MPVQTEQQKATAHILSSESTWRLVGLSVITLGIYCGLFVRRKTAELNRLLPETRRIPTRLPLLVLNLQILAALLLLPSIFAEDTESFSVLSDAVDLAGGVSLLVWGFYARSRANHLFDANRGSFAYFSRLWTFLFSPFYFNYRVNVLSEAQPRGAV